MIIFLLIDKIILISLLGAYTSDDERQREEVFQFHVQYIFMTT